MQILIEDPAFIAVDKPAGMPVIPGRDPAHGSVVERLQSSLGERLWVVHRLDADTTGVVLFARTAEAHRTLCMGFEHHEVRKEYLARVFGSPASAGWTCDMPIAEGRKGRMRLGGPEAKPSSTAFEQVPAAAEANTAVPPDTTVVRATPLTSRRHQVRVHLAACGLPVVGDDAYVDAARVVGGFDPTAHPACRDPALRMMLHAARLVFRHPATAATIDIQAAPPHWAL